MPTNIDVYYDENKPYSCELNILSMRDRIFGLEYICDAEENDNLPDTLFKLSDILKYWDSLFYQVIDLSSLGRLEKGVNLEKNSNLK